MVLSLIPPPDYWSAEQSVSPTIPSDAFGSTSFQPCEMPGIVEFFAREAVLSYD
jgi:hypothetical protein